MLSFLLCMIVTIEDFPLPQTDQKVTPTVNEMDEQEIRDWYRYVYKKVSDD